jgi:hypothetical protein
MSPQVTRSHSARSAPHWSGREFSPRVFTFSRYSTRHRAGPIDPRGSGIGESSGASLPTRPIRPPPPARPPAETPRILLALPSRLRRLFAGRAIPTATAPSRFDLSGADTGPACPPQPSRPQPPPFRIPDPARALSQIDEIPARKAASLAHSRTGMSICPAGTCGGMQEKEADASQLRLSPELERYRPDGRRAAGAGRTASAPSPATRRVRRYARNPDSIADEEGRAGSPVSTPDPRSPDGGVTRCPSLAPSAQGSGCAGNVSPTRAPELSLQPVPVPASCPCPRPCPTPDRALRPRLSR